MIKWMKRVFGSVWFKASGPLIGWFMFFRVIRDSMTPYLQANPWVLYATVFTILSYLILFGRRLFLSSRTKELISKGIQFNAERMLSTANDHLKTKNDMRCPCCGSENMNLKGLNRFNIDVTSKRPKGRVGLLSGVVGCDNCGLIQQHNLPLSLFSDEGDVK